MTRRRWIVRIALCLLIGVVTTVGVAWGLASTQLQSHFRWQPLELSQAQANDLIGSFSRRHDLPYEMIAPDGESWAMGVRGQSCSWLDVYFIDYDVTPLGDFEAELTLRVAHTKSIGWPMRAVQVDHGGNMPVLQRFLQDRVDRAWQGRPESRNLHNISSWSVNGPGFTVDTIFYAVIWFALIFAPREFKRWNRARRGLCPMCKYDLRGNRADRSQPTADSRTSAGCPECGWGRE